MILFANKTIAFSDEVFYNINVKDKNPDIAKNPKGLRQNLNQVKGVEKEMTTNGSMEPKHLAARMGISPKRLRALLRADYSRKAEVKGKKWEIDSALAKKVEKEYKAKKAKKEAAKKAEIAKDLEGEE